MIRFFLKELHEIVNYIKRNYTEIIVIGMSMFFMIFQIYYPLKFSLPASYLLYFLLFPLLTIIFLLRNNPFNYGLRLGDIKLWGFYVIITIIIGIPVLLLGSLFSSVGQYYTQRFDYYRYERCILYRSRRRNHVA